MHKLTVQAAAQPQSVPLWQLLQAASAAVQAVSAGRALEPALQQIAAPVRPGAQALAYHALRELGRARALCQLLVQRKPSPAVLALLHTTLALLWAPHGAPYEPHTLVNQAVEAARRCAATKHSASFINACLRRFLREQDTLLAACAADPQAVYNHPTWWIECLRADHPQHWASILASAQTPPVMSLRVNVRRTSVSAYLQILREQGVQACSAGPYSVVLQAPLPVQQLPGFAQGWVSVQDVGAQQAAPLLLQGLGGAQPLRILDACAAPGGKTGHLLELCQAQVTALDISPKRCERIVQNLQRLGLQARVLAADAADPAAWWDGQPFDAILLDAPCTTSGIVRRHPDARWLRRHSDIAQLAAVQKQLVHALWPLLKPGGRLLYCTCSVFKAEGQDQIAAFLRGHNEAAMLESPGHLLPCAQGRALALQDNAHWQEQHDGFYYALIQKTVH